MNTQIHRGLHPTVSSTNASFRSGMLSLDAVCNTQDWFGLLYRHSVMLGITMAIDTSVLIVTYHGLFFIHPSAMRLSSDLPDSSLSVKLGDEVMISMVLSFCWLLHVS
jgi:hypothetical protein